MKTLKDVEIRKEIAFDDAVQKLRSQSESTNPPSLTLRLSSNNFSLEDDLNETVSDAGFDVLETLAIAIQNNRTLKEITVIGYYISNSLNIWPAKAWPLIAQAVKDHPTIEKLKIDLKKIITEQIEMDCLELLTGSAKIKAFSLFLGPEKQYEFRGDFLENLGLLLQQKTSLQSIRISFQHFHRRSICEDIVIPFVKNICYGKELEQLILDGIELSEIGVLHLILALEGKTGLKKLVLHKLGIDSVYDRIESPISISLIHHLTSFLMQQKKLIELDLGNNFFALDKTKLLLANLDKIPALQKLSISCIDMELSDFVNFWKTITLPEDFSDLLIITKCLYDRDLSLTICDLIENNLKIKRLGLHVNNTQFFIQNLSRILANKNYNIEEIMLTDAMPESHIPDMLKILNNNQNIQLKFWMFGRYQLPQPYMNTVYSFHQGGMFDHYALEMQELCMEIEIANRRNRRNIIKDQLFSVAEWFSAPAPTNTIFSRLDKNMKFRVMFILYGYEIIEVGLQKYSFLLLCRLNLRRVAINNNQYLPSRSRDFIVNQEWWKAAMFKDHNKTPLPPLPSLQMDEEKTPCPSLRKRERDTGDEEESQGKTSRSLF